MTVTVFGHISSEENLAKIARRVKDYRVEILHAPRPGKKLLVLDIDYTLFGRSYLATSVGLHSVTRR